MHPDTIEERVRHACTVFDHDEEARLRKGIVADLLDAFGPADPLTLQAQADLAFCYYTGAYNLAEAINLAGQIIDDIGRVLGPEHNAVRTARAVLSGAYRASGRQEDADAVYARYPLPDDEDEDEGSL